MPVTKQLSSEHFGTVDELNVYSDNALEQMWTRSSEVSSLIPANESSGPLIFTGPA